MDAIEFAARSTAATVDSDHCIRCRYPVLCAYHVVEASGLRHDRTATLLRG